MPAIRIVDYDPRWPMLFEEEKARIQNSVGRWLVDVQHVGSTAVPGLAAKPTIDIMPGLRSLNDAPNVIEPLQRLGYRYFPEYEDELPERRFFRRPGAEDFRGRGTHHVHVVETSSEFWRRLILFRDYLRSHPDVAADYARLKRGLAAKLGEDSVAYTEAKTDFIRTIEHRAAAESLP